MAISPGVYTKIIDLSAYLQDVPGTIGFVPILSRRGPDNQLQYIASYRTWKDKYGDPNILDYGKYYGQGPYVAENHLKVATSLYTIRCLPEDATYSNIFLALKVVDPNEGAESSSSSGDEIWSAVPYHAEVEAVSFENMNTVAEMDTRVNVEGTQIEQWIDNGIGFICYFKPVGRGDSYDDFSVKVSKHANNQLRGIYILDFYETQSDGGQEIVESFTVSFEKNTVDESGESLWIEDVVNRYSTNMNCKVAERAEELIDAQSPEYYKNDPTQPDDLYATEDPLDLGYKAWIIQEKETTFETSKTSLATALDQLATARAMPQTSAAEVQDRNANISAASLAVASARSSLNTSKQELEDAYLLDMLVTQDPDTATPLIEPIPMMYGSEGSLMQIDPSSGKESVHGQTATQILNWAYSGLLINPITGKLSDEIIDLDDIYFTLVYDAGYPLNVKFAAEDLVKEVRRDCVLITDCLDQPSFDNTMTYVKDEHLLNSRYVARYDSYSRIYDKFIGRDIWVTPVYHMANIIPLSDIMYELWWAPAGFNRATINDIKELRYSPKLGERDQLYLMQVNPIVKFNVGYTVWGQLTTQKRPTALQDLNIMRLVLYIKRALEQYCKFFIFEFNDQVTWDQIKNGIIPFLERIRDRRGLKDYDVEVGATEYEFKAKICHVNVSLTPMRIIEKIELNLYIY